MTEAGKPTLTVNHIVLWNKGPKNERRERKFQPNGTNPFSLLLFS